MDLSSLLMGILPLLVFVIADSFASLKWALILACVMAMAELIFSLVAFHSIDEITLLSFALVLLLSFFAWKKNSDRWFKLQPVILSLFFALYLLISYYFDRPLFAIAFDKYQDHLPPQVLLHFDPQLLRAYFARVSFFLGFCLLGHAFLTLWAALKLNKWWWIAMRGIGFYLALFLASFLASRIPI